MSDNPKDDRDVDRMHLATIRKRLGLTQTEMASRIGMGARAYSDLETGISKVRLVHTLAAERVSLQEARARQDATLAEHSVIQDARAIIRHSGT